MIGLRAELRQLTGLVIVQYTPTSLRWVDLSVRRSPAPTPDEEALAYARYVAEFHLGSPHIHHGRAPSRPEHRTSYPATERLALLRGDGFFDRLIRDQDEVLERAGLIDDALETILALPETEEPTTYPKEER